MRVIAGSFKGRRIDGGRNYQIRPTTDRIKESIFTIIGNLISERTVLDLFSGSGNLGIEALSRGANEVTFVEKSSSSISLLKKNINHVGISTSNYHIIQSDVLQYCTNTANSYDLILADPPFIYPPLPQLVTTITSQGILEENGIFVIEHELTNPIDKTSPNYNIIQQKKYGRSLVSFLVRNVHES